MPEYRGTFRAGRVCVYVSVTGMGVGGWGVEGERESCATRNTSINISSNTQEKEAP